jgi:DUF218 domain
VGVRGLGGKVSFGVAVVTLGGIGSSELLHWLAWRSGRRHAPPSGSVGLIVLGYHSRKDESLHPVQKWRVAIARRAVDPGSDGLTVFSGGTRVGIRSEAEAMAAHYEALGASPRLIEIEDQSVSTWENVAFSLPLVAHCNVIVFASDSMHAARARRYARKQRPDLSEQLISGSDYRFLERWWLKVPVVAYELLSLTRNRLQGRVPQAPWF